MGRWHPLASGEMLPVDYASPRPPVADGSLVALLTPGCVRSALVERTWLVGPRPRVVEVADHGVTTTYRIERTGRVGLTSTPALHVTEVRNA